jgi:Peptidase family M23
MTGDQLGTFMYVPQKPDEVRTLAVTRRGLFAVAGLAALVLLFVSLVAFDLFRNQPSESASLSLRRENHDLLGELDKMERRLATLDGQMSILMRRNEELRILADLPRIPVEVTAVGVGGPGHEGVGGLPALEAADGDLIRRLNAAEGDLDFLLRRSKLVARSMEEAEAIIHAKTERWSSTPSVWPTDGFLSSPFSYARRHPILGSFRPHYGVDISARAGNKVVATADGLVTYSDWRNGSGFHVEIDHGYGLVTKYSHCEKLLVGSGGRVRRGTPVGLVGSTGFSIGPHVHYEVHQNGHPVDPTKFIFPNVVSD